MSAAASPLQVEVAIEQLTAELYRLRPAWRTTFGAELYVTVLEAEREQAPEWQRARLAARNMIYRYMQQED